VTGFLGHSADELVTGVEQATTIDPERCAATARERFSPAQMADGYEAVYRSALERARDERS
jgi:hypothetical protein